MVFINTLPPLKINGWKMKFPFGSWPIFRLSDAIFFFQGVFKYPPCSMYHNQRWWTTRVIITIFFVKLDQLWEPSESDTQCGGKIEEKQTSMGFFSKLLQRGLGRVPHFFWDKPKLIQLNESFLEKTCMVQYTHSSICKVIMHFLDIFQVLKLRSPKSWWFSKKNCILFPSFCPVPNKKNWPPATIIQEKSGNINQNIWWLKVGPPKRHLMVENLKHWKVSDCVCELQSGFLGRGRFGCKKEVG